MASEVKTDSRFGLSGPNYLLGPDFEAVIGPIEAVEVVKKQMSPQKKRDICPIRPAGFAAGKKQKPVACRFSWQFSKCSVAYCLPGLKWDQVPVIVKPLKYPEETVLAKPDLAFVACLLKVSQLQCISVVPATKIKLTKLNYTYCSHIK